MGCAPTNGLVVGSDICIYGCIKGIMNFSQCTFVLQLICKLSACMSWVSRNVTCLLVNFQGQLGSVSSPESQQQTGNSQIYGTSRHSESVNAGSQGTFSPYRSGSAPLGFYALQRESVFPERPGQPECQFYMKTGDCKFGAVCRFHHPRERLIPAPDCVLSPIGLPLRPVSSFFIIPFFLPSNYLHLVYVKCFYQNLSLGGGKTELQNRRSHT